MRETGQRGVPDCLSDSTIHPVCPICGKRAIRRYRAGSGIYRYKHTRKHQGKFETTYCEVKQ